MCPQFPDFQGLFGIKHQVLVRKIPVTVCGRRGGVCLCMLRQWT